MFMNLFLNLRTGKQHCQQHKLNGGGEEKEEGDGGTTTTSGETLHQAEICVDCAGPLKRVQLIRAYGEIKTIIAAPWQLEEAAKLTA